MFPSNPSGGGNPPPKKGGGERLRRRHKQPLAVPPGAAATSIQQPTLYSPSIYTYTCRGSYHTSSDAKEGNEGVCNGFKSRLEILYDEHHQHHPHQQPEVMTRAEALKRFSSMTADFDGYEPEDFGADMGGVGGSDFHQQAKTVLISPALIYKDKSASIKSTPPTADENNKKQQPVNPIVAKDHDTLPEEELIKRQEWSCYGSTDVEYLVLQNLNTGEKKIAAVAPRNTGFSRRTIESDDSIRSITRIGLGFLDIIHDNNSIVTPTAPEQEQHHPSSPSLDKGEAEDGTRTRTPEEQVPQSRPPIVLLENALATAKATALRTYEFSGLVGQHMQMNAQWLSENVRDEFPSRTYHAGEKIVAQLPKTVDQTFGTMSKIISSLFEDDDDDDDDDGRRL